MSNLYLSVCNPFAIRLLSVTNPFAIPSFIYPFSVFGSDVDSNAHTVDPVEVCLNGSHYIWVQKIFLTFKSVDIFRTPSVQLLNYILFKQKYSNKIHSFFSTVSHAHPVSFLFPRVSISSSFLEVQGGSFRCSFLRDPVVLSTTASKGRWRVSLNDLFNTPLSQYAPLIRHSHLQLVRICRIFWTLAETTASLCNHRSLFLTILILG